MTSQDSEEKYSNQALLCLRPGWVSRTCCKHEAHVEKTCGCALQFSTLIGWETHWSSCQRSKWITLLHRSTLLCYWTMLYGEGGKGGGGRKKTCMVLPISMFQLPINAYYVIIVLLHLKHSLHFIILTFYIFPSKSMVLLTWVCDCCLCHRVRRCWFAVVEKTRLVAIVALSTLPETAEKDNHSCQNHGSTNCTADYYTNPRHRKKPQWSFSIHCNVTNSTQQESPKFKPSSDSMY